MCCILIDIAMLVFGIITLVRGRFLLTRAKEVRGWPARLIGVVLLLPFPLAFLAGIVLGAIFVVQGQDVQGKDLELVTRGVGRAIVVLCFLTAIGIAVAYAQPVRKHRADEDIEEVDVPEHYHEHFQAEEESRPRPRLDGPEVTDEPPRPSARPEDDRIRD
jgi:hypothetical protein